MVWENDRGSVHQGLGELGIDNAVMTLLTFIYKTIELIYFIFWVVARFIGDLE